MFSHVMLGADDIEAARAFYDAVLGTLGHGPGRLDARGRLFYDAPGGPFVVSRPIDGEPASHANGGTIGFLAPSPWAVEAFHAAGIAHGGRDEGAPGPRMSRPDSHAAYLRDPAGNKICAWHFGTGR